MGPTEFHLIDDSHLQVPLAAKNPVFTDLTRMWLVMVGVCVTLCLLYPRPAEATQAIEYGKEGKIDLHGTVYVSSDEGKLIKVADTSHCSEGIFAPDRQTFGCRVKGRLLPEGYAESPILEIYRKGGQRTVIAPGGQIGEWHFWRNSQHVAVCSYLSGGPEMHILYDVATGTVIEKLEEPSDKSLLPQWAKDRLQIESESVPMSPALTQERTKWVVKVLWQIQNIKPGMRRKDLFKVFRTEGGIQGTTYVLIECPYVKVDVRFKSASNGSDEDIIESVSKPYLAWMVMD